MIPNNQSKPFKVFCRFRSPLEDTTKNLLSKVDYSSTKILTISSASDDSTIMKFEFDHIFFPETSQEEVFRIAAKPIIDDLLQGFNGTILAYGQTSSGKTYTITGPDIFDPISMGIIPRMISTVFDYIDSGDENLEYTIKVSYCELYLEKIYDLTDSAKKHLKIRENKTQGIYIQNLSENFVSSDFDVFELLRIGTENKHVMSTKMNTRSSRSHTIFIMSVDIRNFIDLSGKNGKLRLVDLAGSERVSKTGAEGLRLKELKNINKSLNALTSVINALTDSKSIHIPYRDSKLTRILQDSFGGNSKTVMILACNPLVANESETVSTLRFGSIAKAIVNKPKINREMTPAELKLRLLKVEDELRKKATKIQSLEEALAKFNIPLPDMQASNDKNEDSLNISNTENDEFLIELEEASNKLASLTEENSRLKKEFKELSFEFEESEDLKKKCEQLVHMLEEKNLKIEGVIKNKISLTRRLSLEKTVLTEKIEKAQSKKIELERTLNEKNAENEDIQLNAKVYIEKQENSEDSSHLIEELKSQLKEEQQKYKKHQIELEDVQIRYGLALHGQASDKRSDEKEVLSREIKARTEKITSLEEELEQIIESSRFAKRILTEDEKSLNESTEGLEKKLDELATMYKQLISRQSSSNIEKQINLRKISRFTEKINTLEQELIKRRESLAKTEAEAFKILDEMASQSIFNRIRLPIKGGGGKGVRSSTTRLSLKPRQYSSMKFV